MEPVTYHVTNRIAFATIANPPVNALSLAVRQGLSAVLDRFAADSGADALLLTGSGSAFAGGADIAEFGKPYTDPTLWDIDDRLLTMTKPVIAVLNGFALGGGLELAFHCHWRVAAPVAVIGLPEVQLGLMPGAGGTQYWTRAAGPQSALEFLTTGKTVRAAKAEELGLVDSVIESDLLTGAMDFARAKVGAALPDWNQRTSRIEQVDPAIFTDFVAANRGRWKGLHSPERIVHCIEAATRLQLAEALALEREEFARCADTAQSRALIHLFFAERQSGRVEGSDPEANPAPIRSVGVVGAGTMGAGIAMCVANAGIAAVLTDRSAEQIDSARGRIEKTYASAVAKGRSTPERADAVLGRIAFATDLQELAQCDLVIEAVFEDRAIKQSVIAGIAEVLRPDALIATNTSMLDIDVLALSCPQPERFLGLHFFSPADVMKLLEVVAGKATSPQVLHRASRLGRSLGKIPVICGNGEGFIGNFVLDRYGREADCLIEDGASPWQVDAAMRRFGFPMGLCEMRDMAGLDVVWRIRQERREWERLSRYPRLVDQIYAAGRLGQKSGAGYYLYEGRTGSPDPWVEDLSIACAAAAGITRRSVAEEEVEARVLGAMVSAGADLLDRGIASSAADIDLVMVHGFGFPRAKGGPMQWAAEQGINRIASQIAGWRAAEGSERWPACPRLDQAADRGHWA